MVFRTNESPDQGPAWVAWRGGGSGLGWGGVPHDNDNDGTCMTPKGCPGFAALGLKRCYLHENPGDQHRHEGVAALGSDRSRLQQVPCKESWHGIKRMDNTMTSDHRRTSRFCLNQNPFGVISGNRCAD